MWAIAYWPAIRQDVKHKINQIKYNNMFASLATFGVASQRVCVQSTTFFSRSFFISVELVYMTDAMGNWCAAEFSYEKENKKTRKEWIRSFNGIVTSSTAINYIIIYRLNDWMIGLESIGRTFSYCVMSGMSDESPLQQEHPCARMSSVFLRTNTLHHRHRLFPTIKSKWWRPSHSHRWERWFRDSP